jgi:ribosomal protein S18 acetylase RimI-like enzyme
MDIRILAEPDASALFELRGEALQREPEAFGEAYEEHIARNSVELTATRLREGPPNSFVVGAFQNDKLAGMAGFHRYGGKFQHKGHVWGVYVTNSLRGQGAARKLMEFLLATARQLEGLSTLLLHVNQDNTPAVELYRRIGFREFGLEPDAICVNGIMHAQLLMRCEVRR